MPTVKVWATGRTLSITGVDAPVNINSAVGEPAPATVTFGDGTVLNVDRDGGIVRSTHGAAEVFIAHDPAGDLATVIGPLQHVRSDHGGNVQQSSLGGPVPPITIHRWR